MSVPYSGAASDSPLAYSAEQIQRLSYADLAADHHVLLNLNRRRISMKCSACGADRRARIAPVKLTAVGELNFRSRALMRYRGTRNVRRSAINDSRVVVEKRCTVPTFIFLMRLDQAA